MLSVVTGGALQISGNYTGNGQFLLFEEYNDNQVQAHGYNGSVELGIDVSDNATWSGIRFEGADGKFAARCVAGPIHVVEITDAKSISGEALTQERQSLIEMDGFGKFSQAIYDIANSYGRHDKIFDLDFEGLISMNTTVVDDTEDEILTTDITAEDM